MKIIYWTSLVFNWIKYEPIKQSYITGLYDSNTCMTKRMALQPIQVNGQLHHSFVRSWREAMSLVSECVSNYIASMQLQDQAWANNCMSKALIYPIAMLVGLSFDDGTKQWHTLILIKEWPLAWWRFGKMLLRLNEVWEFRTIQFRDGGADGVVEKVMGPRSRSRRPRLTAKATDRKLALVCYRNIFQSVPKLTVAWRSVSEVRCGVCTS